MIVPNKRTDRATKQPLTIVSSTDENGIRRSQQRTGSAASNQRENPLWLSVATWLMEGFALYGAALYPLEIPRMGRVEPDDTSDDGDRTNQAPNA
jgi:hypothetical protein